MFRLNSCHVSLCIALPCLLLCSCVQRTAIVRETPFTKIDSLTEQYLELQDSMLHAWNVMINDDNYKIATMGNVLTELQESGRFEQELLDSVAMRLDKMKLIRYDQKTIANARVISDYDYLTGSLTDFLTQLVESHPNDRRLAEMITQIELANKRIPAHRHNYDFFVIRYNQFLEANEEYLKEIDARLSADQRPYFYMTTSGN